MFLLKREYFNKTFIIKGLCTALLFSCFLYLGYFEFEVKIINTITGLLALYFLLTIPRPSLFYAGFFIGILWFYWISFSFVYYELYYLMPLVILGLGLGYGVIFLLLGIVNKPIFRILSIVLLSYFEPFGFNWLKPELLFVESYFSTTKLVLLLLLVASYCLYKGSRSIYTILLTATFFISFYIQKPNESLIESDLMIAMPQLNISQEEKWERTNLTKIIKTNFAHINQAIYSNKDLVILPETAFPMLLNQDKLIMNMLKEKSQDITIITGALYKENDQYNNTTYLFQNGKYQVAHKVVLVPFGESVPLPEKIKNFINDTFYDGAKDYTKAQQPTDFLIQRELFRNAICYEATSNEIYQNLGNTKYLIVTSNNAWFTPSIEPVLQKMLLKYFAKKHHVIIYHVANGSPNAIIRP